MYSRRAAKVFTCLHSYQTGPMLECSKKLQSMFRLLIAVSLENTYAFLGDSKLLNFLLDGSLALEVEYQLAN